MFAFHIVDNDNVLALCIVIGKIIGLYLPSRVGKNNKVRYCSKRLKSIPSVWVCCYDGGCAVWFRRLRYARQVNRPPPPSQKKTKIITYFFFTIPLNIRIMANGYDQISMYSRSNNNNNTNANCSRHKDYNNIIRWGVIVAN